MVVKKGYFGIICLVFLAVVVWVVGCTPQQPKSELKTGYGWSVNDDESAAVTEAATALKTSVTNPDLVVLYSTVGYDVNTVVEQVHTNFADAKVFGITSCYAVVTKDGVHVGEKGSLAMMGFDSADMAVGVAGKEISDPAQAGDAVKTLIQEAVQQAGKESGAKPDMILIGTTPGFEERSIEAIESVFGKDVPVYGGSAADNTIEGNWRAISGKTLIASGVSLAVVYSKTKIGESFACGYGFAGDANTKSGTVTAVEGRTLLQIDGKPAAEVYNEWTDGLVKEELEKGGSILAKTSFNPLARKVSVGQSERLISIHPANIDPKTKSLALFAEVKKGDKLYLLKGDEMALLNRSATVTRRALQESGIESTEIAGGLHIYCAGTMLAVQKNIGKIVPQINAVMAGAPFIGAFTFGEQGLMEGNGNFQGNLMNSMVVFSKE